MVLFSAGAANAGDILRGGTPFGGAAPGGKGTAGPVNAASELARGNARDALARTTAALQSVKAMQEAARAAALKGANHLGADPNHPGQNLPTVPDGLARGGLQVAPGVPKNLAKPETGEDPGLWRGAALPSQRSSNGRVNITVLQTAPQAVLNWQTFNVGKKTTLTFNQDRGGVDKSQWTVFNKIADPSGSPSQILGKIEAPGQVYVINPNGILFGGSAQINLHGLVASSLPINDGLITRGLLSNPDAQFLFSALPMDAGAKGTPAFKPVASLAPGGKYGDVEVRAGAQINSASNSNVGGRVMLVGTNVKNEGTISTPDGQTVLAAGLQVGIAAHPASDARLRGLDVFVGAVAVPPPAKPGDPTIIPPQRAAGTATNSGLIEAPRADTTITGRTVSQQGVIDSSTSVTLNGSINLLANFGAVTVVPGGATDPFFAFTSTGTVELGENSVAQILPELFSEKTVIGTELALRSRVLVQGRNIHLGGNATILAPNADVALNAGSWLVNGKGRALTYSTGQIYLDAGATINVAGTPDVLVPISQNILSLELRGAELADSPLQRKGPLRGPTLNLDIRQRGTFNGLDWVGTPLGNVAGFVGLIEHNVGELTTAGGNVTINAGGSVVLQAGSTVDVSGGYVSFEGGMVRTTRIISDGRIVDIANATPDRVHTSLYDGTFTVLHPKYGTQTTFDHPLALSGEHFEPGYIEGKNSGTVSITAPAMALDGELRGATVTGERQRTAAAAPRLGALSLAFEKQDAAVLNYRSYSPTPPVITFAEGTLTAPAPFALNATGDAAALPAERLAQVLLPPNLFSSFGSVTIMNGEGNVSVPEETKLKLQPRGSLTIAAANVEIHGDITAPNGSLNFTAYKFTPYLDHLFPDGLASIRIRDIDPDRGNIVLGAGAKLSVAGLVVDDRPLALAPLSQPQAIDGGSISIAGFNVDLQQGTAIDASGGVLFARDGRRTYGVGGSIAIKAGNDPKIPHVVGGRELREKQPVPAPAPGTPPDPNAPPPPDKVLTIQGGTLNLGSRLTAASGLRGGSLTIQALAIEIGEGANNSDDKTLRLQPEFFNEGGFNNFTLVGLGHFARENDTFAPAITVAPGTVIHPTAKALLALPYAPGGLGPRLILQSQPLGVRLPVNITLSAPGVRDNFGGDSLVTRGAIAVGAGAHIETDPRGAITLAGETVDLLGSLIAPGGNINVSGASRVAFGDTTGSLTSVHIGSESVLSAAGTVVFTPNAFGFHTGSVLPGGRISVSGNILAESGALLDVSGTNGIVDVLPALLEPGADIFNTPVVPANSGLNRDLYARKLVPTRIESDGGEIVLAGGQHLFSDATLLGAAGGTSALGGSLTVSSGRFFTPGIVANPLDITLQVVSAGPQIPAGATVPGVSPIGQRVGTASGMGHFAASQFAAGGFDSLTLRGTVEFSGPLSIKARRTLSVADAGVIYANGDVSLEAPYVMLGMPFRPPVQQGQVLIPYLDGAGQPYSFKPTNGAASLTVTGNLIDIGNLSLQNIGAAHFIADRGDIRGDGTLNVAGDIYLRAAQIYPPTAVTFTIAASDYQVGSTMVPGSVTVEGSGNRQIPLSAAGQLNIYASNVVQGGALRVPLGGINIGWNGEGTAPINPVTGEAFAISQSIVLAPGSITSVSAVSPIEGGPLAIPFGLNINGVTWIDPTGQDITAGGLTPKVVNISGVNVNSMPGSTIDIRGGGDLFAYRWVPGNGGSRDLLASSTSFAVIPGYAPDFAPYAAFNPAPLNPGLDGAPGYVNTGLRVGDRVHLSAMGSLPEGTYTLLPARYALMPGAMLVTPKAGTPVGTLALPDGSTLVPGYRFNDLSTERPLNPQYSWFEVLTADVLRSRAEYAGYMGNSFLAAGAQSVGAEVPRLARDAGHLTLQAIESMSLRGHVSAAGPERSRGGLVDIASPVDIVITGAHAPSIAGKLTLDAAQLSSFGAESLLIGGVRTVNGDGTANVAVKTNNLIVDNAGTPLQGPEIILVANRGLTLADGAVVEQSGKMRSAADNLILGKPGVAGSGDGTLLRVTSDYRAQVLRQGLGSSQTTNMVIGADALVSGTNVTLDSTFGTSLDPTARIDAGIVALNSGQVSIQLDNPGALNPTSGLVLGGDALRSIQSSNSVSLLSYTTIDLYGSGALDFSGALALHGSTLRGFNNGGGTVSIAARALSLDNRANAAATAALGAPTGTLELKSGSISLGVNQVAVQQFGEVILDAAGGVIAKGTGGFSAQNNLTLRTPVLTAGRSATQSITAGGALLLEKAGAAKVTGGLGASLSLEGTTVTASSALVLPSGSLSVRATTGDVVFDGRVSLNGTEQTFYDLIRYTGGGTVHLAADHGNVTLGAESVISVSAPAGGGDAGRLVISAPEGAFSSTGDFVGRGGKSGRAGSFSLDARSLANFDLLETALTNGQFSESQSFRIRTGDVAISGMAKAHHFTLSTDAGAITVAGTIDASGERGGSIALMGGGSVTLASGSHLTVAAQNFDAAGKGGQISLETRGLGGGLVDLRAGSVIDLGVTANTTSSAALGNFTGTLHLRAPQNAAENDLAVASIGGTINGASNILVEGFKTFDLTGSGVVNATLQNSVRANGSAFIGANGTPAAGYNAMLARILGGNTALESVLSIRPGAEIINATGNLTLGTASSSNSSDWNLATFRFGPDSAPGMLTLRAAGNIVLFNSISDGFVSSDYNSLLLLQNGALPANAQAWSYRLVAGADIPAADFSQTRALAGLTAGSGSLLLGKNGGSGVFVSPGPAAATAAAVGNRFQTIRTGSGDITISAARDVQLLNQFATIYSAGTQVADAKVLPNGGAFDLPIINEANGGALGSAQQVPVYAAQYTLGGGNVTVTAGADVAHYTVISGNLVADSTRELPVNWLYRRGFVNPVTGEFGTARFGDVASTTWWVDFSNFFEGVGALGGGNVTISAGRNVSNVDAVAPTNARMAKGVPNPASLVELGGGDVTIRAGNNIDGGVYYVERGRGDLSAGGSITTNATRSPSLGIIVGSAPAPESTWLPTTVFLGKGQFDISARRDVLLGPAANPFLLPGGFNNTFWYKTYFSTYGAESGIRATSLSGDVTLRAGAVLPTEGVSSAAPLLLTWFQKQLLLTTTPDTAAYYQPWLRLNETSTVPFATAASLMPGTLDVTAFAGDIDIVGSLNLSPSARGNLSLVASGAVNGLNINGVTTINGVPTNGWGVARINLSDANPESIPGTASPFAYQTIVGTIAGAANRTGDLLLSSVDVLFAESGSLRNVLQTKQALHAPGLLHAGDAEPLRIYAGTGDIQGFTLFSPKSARVLAGRDLTDVALYVQNVAEEDISVVAAGRDIIAYNANTPARVLAQSPGNTLNFGSGPLAGDLQISGPGTLEILAGRNLDLGTGKPNADGTALGIVSVGNARNPYLPFAGADLVIGAGIGPSSGLEGSALDFDSFVASLITGENASRYSADLSALLGTDAASLDTLPKARQDLAALAIFYLKLRDAGRDRNDPASAGFGNYDSGFAAIEELFPGADWEGDISLTARQIKTQSGGDVSIFAPGGAVIVGFDAGAGQSLDQGILTESGGNINIFANESITLGTSRIFTLRGGNEIIWSSNGDIAAGTSSKTVASAPPTRVLIDPQSADLKTDLAGLATGGGIGVLATVEGVPPGDVDLIAPRGAIDAGDAGIRSAGNLNVAATTVLNAENIQVSGSSAGAASTAAPSVPSIPAVPPPPTSAGGNSVAATAGSRPEQDQSKQITREEPPSIIVVEVLGYGGGEGPNAN
jgi:filamentous hemagglutinin family protein